MSNRTMTPRATEVQLNSPCARDGVPSLAAVHWNGRSLQTCDSVSEVLVVGLPQQPDQSGNPITVLNGDLVVGIFAVRDVLQRSTSCVMNLQHRRVFDGAPLKDGVRPHNFHRPRLIVHVERASVRLSFLQVHLVLFKAFCCHDTVFLKAASVSRVKSAST